MNYEREAIESQKKSEIQNYILESETELKDFILGFSKMLNLESQEKEAELIRNIKNSMFSASNKDSATKKLKLENESSSFLLDLVTAESLNISPNFRSILEFRLSSLFSLKNEELPNEFKNNPAIKKSEFQRTYSKVTTDNLVKA